MRQWFIVFIMTIYILTELCDGEYTLKIKKVTSSGKKVSKWLLKGPSFSFLSIALPDNYLNLKDLYNYLRLIKPIAEYEEL